MYFRAQEGIERKKTKRKKPSPAQFPPDREKQAVPWMRAEGASSGLQRLCRGPTGCPGRWAREDDARILPQALSPHQVSEGETMNRRHRVRDPGGVTERGVKEFRVSWFLQLKEGLECRGIARRSQFLLSRVSLRANP